MEIIELIDSRFRVASRPPNDDFSYYLFTHLTQKYAPLDTAAYSMWSFGYQTRGFDEVNNEHFFDQLEEIPSNIVLNIRDNFSYLGEYDFQCRKKTDGAEDIEVLCNRYPEINFILCTSLENLDKELGKVSNLQLVPLGGDITNQATLYPTVDPVLDKNFNSNKTFISLNRQARFHRVFAVSLLIEQGLDKTGHITLMDKEKLRCNDFSLVNWQFSRKHIEPRDMHYRGYPKVKKIYFDDLVDDPNVVCTSEDFCIYPTNAPNDNVLNFENVLRDLYKDSFVEIVSETTYAEPSFLLTEKTLNSIYACNIPIFISGVGTVAHLREVGFDMFDDIVDHSYDLIDDPILRTHEAIRRNYRLLSDTEFAKQQWDSCQSRLLQNVAFAKHAFYQYYARRAEHYFSNLMWK